MRRRMDGWMFSPSSSLTGTNRTSLVSLLVAMVPPRSVVRKQSENCWRTSPSS